jgi:hypothetical protein
MKITVFLVCCVMYSVRIITPCLGYVTVWEERKGGKDKGEQDGKVSEHMQCN